ncbi:putative signal peptidase complex subunit 2 [Mycena indigotica]|uniref:Signal peptidase complex subunit 2 n=1 Tax=Mycena indigotica TaxID=2126181 RepID=A0A8H6SID3_9AGAR|nr:putative signal peptidase complex subunit 2 [Mycena indigotica]KAF7299392.1 putative signal peptidase complex subunit 2 [Mycena indigotica]
MARKKTPANGSPSAPPEISSSSATSIPSPSSPEPLGPLSLPPLPGARDVVKVNNLSSTELKNACDDALKRYLSRPELFKQNHQHTDVRLALGWLSVFVAGGTGLYGYKVEFEASKPVVWAGLIVYLLLTFTQTLYAYFVEGDTVYVGKRKTFSKRIETERITIASRTIPVSSQPPATENATPEHPWDHTPEYSLEDANHTPLYSLGITYLRSTSANKSLLARNKSSAQSSYAAFFDGDGVLDADVFEQWVGKAVEECMSVKDKSS